jgi:SAM-dependent methyltransferase
MIETLPPLPTEPEHPEADFVMALQPRRVLDAGCGNGRVAVELARRGIAVVGVDRDPQQLRAARRRAPRLSWHLADLATLRLGQRFDLILLAGNVLLFLDPSSEGAVLRTLARHLAPGGRLVAGFALAPGYLALAEYDRLAHAAGLTLRARYAAWDRQPWHAAAHYVVTVHRRQADHNLLPTRDA